MPRGYRARKRKRARDDRGRDGEETSQHGPIPVKAKVLSSNPGRSISAPTLAPQPCLIFLCTNIRLPNWRPQKAVRICIRGHETAAKLPREARGAVSILPQCGSEPVLQRAIPQFRGQQVGKEKRLCSQQLMGRQRSPWVLPVPCPF